LWVNVTAPPAPSVRGRRWRRPFGVNLPLPPAPSTRGL
jgi:hypothetical protein